MHGPEESDSVVGAGKPTNKAERSAAEPVEPRTGTKGNAGRQSTRQTQSWASVSQALERIRQVGPSVRFAVTHPRWEPYAGKPHVRIWAGGARQLASLPLRRCSGSPGRPIPACRRCGSRGLSSAVMQALDFAQFGTIIDVGGGEGALLADILSAHPKLRGMLFDQPNVIARADTFLERAGVRSRCDLVGGSFFASVPSDGDAYILKFILHDWDDATSLDILRACRRAMSAEAILLVLERMIGPPNESADAKFADLNMLVEPGGQERTAEEFASLFNAASFKLTRVVPTGTRINLIEGVPV